MDAQGMVGLNEEFSKEGIPWPRVTTDSRAEREKIPADEQKEAVALARHLLEKLKTEAKHQPSKEVEGMTKEANLYFSLGEKLWLRGGYRNQALALILVELGVQRCFQITIHTKGTNTGPKLPEVFNHRSIEQYIALYVSLIPESERHTRANLAEKIKANPPKADYWIMAGIEISKLAPEIIVRDGNSRDYDVSGVFNESSMARMYIIFDKENIAALLSKYSLLHIRKDSAVESLAYYFKEGGALDVLLNEPANAKKFGDIMKNKYYQLNYMPFMKNEYADVQRTSIEAETALNQEKFAERLFSSK